MPSNVTSLKLHQLSCKASVQALRLLRVLCADSAGISTNHARKDHVSYYFTNESSKRSRFDATTAILRCAMSEKVVHTCRALKSAERSNAGCFTANFY